jgi:CRP-like cAMP-binding protein
VNTTLTLIEKTVYLKAVDVLAEVPTEALAQLAARAAEVRAEPSDVLFREGEEDQGTFIVVEGMVELTKDRTLVRVLREGTTHGELFLGEHEPHQYTAIAREPSLLLNLGRADVLDAMLEHPEFGVAMVKDLALRLHRLTARVVELEREQKIVPTAETPEEKPLEPS